MKTSLCAMTVVLFALCGLGHTSRALGQEHAVWGPAVSFPNGTFIQTGIGTIPPGKFDLRITTSVATTASTTAEQGAFRRILKLSDGRAIVYEITVRRIEEGKRFEIDLRSWKPTPDEARAVEIDPARVETDFLRNYTAPIAINDGDTVALDVLFNPRTGVKLVDYFRITSSRPIVQNGSAESNAKARLLEIEDIEFSVNKFKLSLNGEAVYAGEGGMGGRFIWLDVPQTGRFIFSLIPLAEADGFHRSAFLTRTRISFTHGADKYELSSPNSIIPASGVFHLWVRFDPTFTFPLAYQAGTYVSLGAADRLPLTAKRE